MPLSTGSEPPPPSPPQAAQVKTNEPRHHLTLCMLKLPFVRREHGLVRRADGASWLWCVHPKASAWGSSMDRRLLRRARRDVCVSRSGGYTPWSARPGPVSPASARAPAPAHEHAARTRCSNHVDGSERLFALPLPLLAMFGYALSGTCTVGVGPKAQALRADRTHCPSHAARHHHLRRAAVPARQLTTRTATSATSNATQAAVSSAIRPLPTTCDNAPTGFVKYN